MWVRGLKLHQERLGTIQQMSHPMWVRGLKLVLINAVGEHAWSHPMWVRGLKHHNEKPQHKCSSRTLCGCVDWNCLFIRTVCAWLCRTLCGCVDWNCWCSYCIFVYWVAPYVGAWIETQQSMVEIETVSCRTLCGCVDWNKEKTNMNYLNYVAPYVGAWIETSS